MNRSERYYLIHNVKLMSLNEAYATQPTKGGGSKKQAWKNKTWRTKTYEASQYQYLIQETLGCKDALTYGGDKLKVESSLDRTGVALTMVFYVPPKELRVVDADKFKGRDVSNYIKLIEDAVFEYLGVDDSFSLDPLAFKRESYDDDWHILLILSNNVTAMDPVYHGGFMIDPYDLRLRQ